MGEVKHNKAVDNDNVVEIISASVLDGATRAKLEAVFKKKHAGEVEFVYTVNPDVIGGVMVKDSDGYYDATFKGQLEKIKNLL